MCLRGICLKILKTYDNTPVSYTHLDVYKRQGNDCIIDVIGLSEVNWPDEGNLWSTDYRVINTGTEDDRPEYEGVESL